MRCGGGSADPTARAWTRRLDAVPGAEALLLRGGAEVVLGRRELLGPPALAGRQPELARHRTDRPRLHLEERAAALAGDEAVDAPAADEADVAHLVGAPVDAEVAREHDRDVVALVVVRRHHRARCVLEHGDDGVVETVA